VSQKLAGRVVALTIRAMRIDRFLRVPLLLMTALVLGCSYANIELNDSHLHLQDRVSNHTRAAVFADVTPPSTPNAASVLRSDSAITTPQQFRLGPADADGFFVGVALSGGGSRSANFSAACMFQLERAGFMRHVDYISSVSGGSLAGAYYCSHDKEWNPANAQAVLTHPFATDLITGTLLPWNLFAFAFTDYDRSDLLASSFRRVLFSRDGRELTYADLRPDRPRLLVNATDLQSGRRFVFCNETFDDLNSDLSRFPLAYAVASSASFPLVLHPVTLRDFSTTFPEYRHLIDGGVDDNLGVQSLVETYASQIEAAKKAGKPDPYPHGAVLVIISAQTRFSARLSGLSDMGLMMSLKTAAGLTSSSLVNRASSATLAETIVDNARDDATALELRTQIRDLEKKGFTRLQDHAGHDVRVIYISLTQLDGLSKVPFLNFSQAVNSIDTYFNISTEEAYSLYEAADLLVKEKLSAPIQDVVNELEGRAPATQSTEKK
jgi:predicted acylesterase/phospholipase RssA